jgi:hypothetical protein
VTCTAINGTAFAGTSGDVVSFGAANTPADAGFLASNVVRKDAANTLAAAGSLNVSASTVADAVRVPVKAGFTAGATGSIGYDSTNSNYHVYDGADGLLAPFASAPTTGHVVTATVSSGKVTLSDGGALTSGTLTSIATTSPITGGTITATGTIACATCVTSAAALTSNVPVIGGGGQAAVSGFSTGSTGTITSGKLACVTSTNTMGNCTALPPGNVLGVFNSSTTYVSTGIVSVTLDATVNVTFGDILCNSTSVAAEAHDNGSTACANGQWIGIVTTTASSVSSATTSLRFQ